MTALAKLAPHRPARAKSTAAKELRANDARGRNAPANVLAVTCAPAKLAHCRFNAHVRML
jgi:hypothetical protein